MKRNNIFFILLLLLGIVVESCQNLDIPTPQAPELHVREAEAVTSTTVYLRNYSDTYSSSPNCKYYYLLSSNENFRDSLVYDAYLNSQIFIQGLKPNTTYYYKMIGTDGYAKACSEVKNFTTSAGLSIEKLTYTDWDGTVKEVDKSMSPLGISAIDTNNHSYYAYKIVYENGQWKIPDELMGKDIKVCAIYTPYNDNDFLDEDELGWLKMSTYKNQYKNGGDYLIGWVDGLVEKNGISLNLRHSLARVRFHFSMSEDCSEEHLAVNSIMLKQDANAKIIPTIFWYSLWGKITNVSEFTDIDFGDGFELIKGDQTYNQADVTFYSGNTRNSGVVQIQLNLANGTTYSVPLELKAGCWENGNTYDYNVVYSRTGLSISDVSVKGWNTENMGDINVNN